MAGSYLGSFTVGGAIPGVTATLDQVGTALQNLTTVANAQLALLNDVKSAIQAQASATAAARIAIRAVALADIEIQIVAAANLEANFTAQLSNPAGYLTGLLNAALAVKNNLDVALPTPQLNAQVGAATANKLAFTAARDAIDAEIDALVAIGDALTVAAGIVDQVRGALAAAIAAVNAAISAYIAIGEYLAVAGAHCLIVESNLEDVGAEVAILTPSLGLAGTVPVKVPIVIVNANDGGAVDAIDAVFRTS